MLTEYSLIKGANRERGTKTEKTKRERNWDGNKEREKLGWKQRERKTHRDIERERNT